MTGIGVRAQTGLNRSVQRAILLLKLFLSSLQVKHAQLNFGRFSPGPQGGKMILTPQSTISVIGSVFKGTGSYNAASFYVSGDADAAYSITLPDSSCGTDSYFQCKNDDY